ncbi:capsule polysaccharide biosynthesis protein [Seiridium cupressi]
MTTFSIPPEYRDQLEVVEIKDTRTDEEILQSLTQYASVTSEKNIWAFWHSGVLNMPGWCQRNVIDWVRICGPDWTIRILDNEPTSPNYALRHVPAELLPEAFVKQEMNGPYVGPHSADFLRGACLLQHGGVFIDVGCILFRHMDRIGWDKLEDPNSPYQVAVPLMYSQTMANHFVAARKGNPFIQRWHEIFTHLWIGHKNHEGLIENPLVAFGAEVNFDESRASNFSWDFAVPPKTVMEYISQVLSWRRLCMLEDAGDGFSGSDYWQNHVFCFDVLKEDWAAEDEIGFSGEKIFDLLTLSRDGDKTTEQYREAEKLVWRLLSQASMEKITHGKGLTKRVSLGILLDKPENEGKDRTPGTFAELLRYGAVHFRQKRENILQKEARKAVKTMKKGLLEP